MKGMVWGLSRLAVFTGLVILGSGTPAFAAEGREAPAERSERLEQRLNQMGQHQEQLMRQVGGQMERLEQRLNQMAGSSATSCWRSGYSSTFASGAKDRPFL